MYSPRSDSTTSTPSRSRAGFKWISSVAIDFDLTTRRAPRRRQIPATISTASPAETAQCTWPPFRRMASAAVCR